MADKEIAKIYAGALLDVGMESNILPRIEEELGSFSELVSKEREFMLFLNAPVITKDKKKELIEKLFSDKFCPVMLNFLMVLIDNGRQLLTPYIYKYLVDLIDQKNNRQKVYVTTSTKLEPGTLKQIEKSIGNKLKKEVIIEESVDSTILGGIVIRIDDTLIDGSIAKDLNIMRAKLIETKVGGATAYED